MIDDKTSNLRLTEGLEETRYMRRGTSGKRFTNSTPVRLLVVTTVCVFVAEALIMMFLSVLPRMGTWMTVFFDATLIVACVLPVFYLSLFRPIQQYLLERALRTSEDKYRLIFETAANLITSVDSEGTLVDCNNRIEKVLGYKREEIIGQNMGKIIQSDYHQKAQKSLSELITTGTARNKEYKMVRKDGRLIDVRINSSSITDEQGNFVRSICIIDDITERKQAETALKKHTLEQNILLKVSQCISGTLDLETVLQIISDGVAQLLDIETAAIYLLEEEELLLGATTPPLDPRMPESLRRAKLADHPHILEAVSTRLPVILPDTKLAILSPAEKEVFEIRQLRSLIYLPFKQEENVIGVLILGTIGQPRKFLDHEIDLCKTITNQLALGVQNARLLTGLKKYANELEDQITERKRAEEALQDSENKLLAAQRIAKLGHYVLDIKTGQWKSSVELDDIFKIAEDYKEDVASWLQIVHPDYRESILNYFQDDVLSKHQKFDREYKIVNAETGREKWVHGLGSLKFDEDGNPVEMFGTIQDITERKQAEEALRLTQFSVDNSTDAVYWIGPDAEFVYVNYAAVEASGYSKEELLTMTVHDISPEFPVEVWPAHWAELKEKKSFVIHTIHQRKDKSIYPVEITVNFIQFGGREINCAIAKDITELKRLQELESRAARLETAGMIAGQVAHDFNNLLAPILAYPEFIRDELPRDNNAHTFLDAIESAAKKIADINQDLLTMGRRGHYTQDIINLNRIVLQAVQEMESRPDAVACKTDLREDLMNIKGGDAQIHRMLTNLIVNAQDAIEDVGQITIKTENYYADNTSIAFGRVPRGEYVKLTVSDNGCGIQDDIIEKILDPFFSTKTADRKRGSGLGLSVVDAVVKDHNGYLDLSSKVGHGTSFYIYFPVTREDAGKEKSERLAGGAETILIVDDDETQREVTSRLLKKLGYQVSSVESGEKAIEFLRENPQDLVILDMVMPGGIDGAETYRRILEINSRQKSIILSGFSESDRVFEAQKLGAGAFVRKPVTKNVIAAAVRTELDRQVDVVAS